VRTLKPHELNLDLIEAHKLATGVTFSLLIPARGAAAAAALGNIVSSNRRLWMDQRQVLDEIGVLVDPDANRDEHGMMRTAADAGASWVVRGRDVIWQHSPGEQPAEAGKAGAMRSLAFLAHGNRLIFHDADLEFYDPRTVGVLAAASLADRAPRFVNGSSRRVTGDGQPGGRTTEMLRPLLSKQLYAHVPSITAVVQPLIGEFVMDAGAFASLPFSRGYGVETSLKVLALDRLDGRDCVQVELPVKYQTGQDYLDLAKQFHEISFTVDVLEEYFLQRRGNPEASIIDIADKYELQFPERSFALHRPAGYDATPFVSRPVFYPPLAGNEAYQGRHGDRAAFRHGILRQAAGE